MSSSIGPYPSEVPGGYWGHVGGHGADIPPFLGQGAGGINSNNYAFGSTPAVMGSSIPPYTPSGIPGGLSPIGGSPLGPPLGIPSVPGYYGNVGGIGGNGIDANRPFNIRCDENDGFKQVMSEKFYSTIYLFNLICAYLTNMAYLYFYRWAYECVWPED